MNAWYESRFTGIFRDFERVMVRPHDPQVSIYAGIVPHLHPEQNGLLHVGGCGWSDEDAATACVGEGIERLFAYPTDQDAVIESSYEDWPLDLFTGTPRPDMLGSFSPATIRPSRFSVRAPDTFDSLPMGLLSRRVERRTSMDSGGIRFSPATSGVRPSFLSGNFDRPRSRNHRSTRRAPSVAGSHRARRFAGGVVGSVSGGGVRSESRVGCRGIASPAAAKFALAFLPNPISL